MMYLYFALVAIAALVVGIIIAVRSKKADGVEYGKLDKVGKVTNVILIPIYFVAMTYCYFLVMLGYSPRGEGILAVVAWVLAIIGATAPSLCALGLGASVALRKKGKSQKSFWVQFSGVVGIAVTILFFVLFCGNLFAPLNWLT